MSRAEIKPPRRVRLGVALTVALLHAIVLAALVRAFAPQIAATVLHPVTRAFDVALPPPPPPAEPPAQPVEERPAGSAAPAGRHAKPRTVTAPEPPLVLSAKPAPVVASTGSADSAGARASGLGTGAGGAGEGLGAGGAGTGTGSGAARAVKLSGDIVSARDYPKATRALRLGSAVTIALTVGVDGRVSACRIVRASRDPEADRITCQLASERFRFRPARNAAGEPVASVYGWQQRWFTPSSE